MMEPYEVDRRGWLRELLEASPGVHTVLEEPVARVPLRDEWGVDGMEFVVIMKNGTRRSVWLFDE
jgi:hypothetical protein